MSEHPEEYMSLAMEPSRKNSKKKKTRREEDEEYDYGDDGDDLDSLAIESRWNLLITMGVVLVVFVVIGLVLYLYPTG